MIIVDSNFVNNFPVFSYLLAHNLSREQVYRAWKKLTTLDWNYWYHDDFSFYTTEDHADTIIARKSNQRTKSWHVRILKVSKNCGYIWMLIAKIFKLRIDDDDDSITREVCLEPDDPRIISPAIVESEPLPAHELLANCRNRSS